MEWWLEVMDACISSGTRIMHQLPEHQVHLQGFDGMHWTQFDTTICNLFITLSLGVTVMNVN